MVRNASETLDSPSISSSDSALADSPVLSTHEPADAESLASIVADCAERGEAVYPRGGGSAWDFGGLPDQPGIVLETKRLDRVLEYPVEDMTITVESGMPMSRLRSILAENNQYLPIDPPHGTIATIGGVMACGWTGPRRHVALRPRDQIIGIGFVDGLGRRLKGGGRVVKNVAGYDFPKLLSGSLGALGVITEMTFKVRPRPESTAIAWVRLHDAHSLEQLLEKLNLSATRPTAIEVLNRSRASVVGEPLSLKADTFVAAIGFDESAKAVAWQCDKIAGELPVTASIDILRDAAAKPLWDSLTEGHAAIEDPSDIIARVVTRPGRLAALLASLDSEEWSVQAHGGQGIAMLKAAVPMTREKALAAYERIYSDVAPGGGSVIWPKCPTEWKPGFPIWGRHRPDQDLMAGVKRALDPKGILNPGRFLGLS